MYLWLMLRVDALLLLLHGARLAAEEPREGLLRSGHLDGERVAKGVRVVRRLGVARADGHQTDGQEGAERQHG